MEIKRRLMLTFRRQLKNLSGDLNHPSRMRSVFTSKLLRNLKIGQRWCQFVKLL
jgi:hypothetical protein